MLSPPTWFDFSAECIYTAQKHKKSKSWRDGVCTCCFVRGWIVLKLFPEGASTTSEPLEVWRLAPNTPEAVAQQEVELEVHLVQLLGNPQPLRGQNPPQLQQQPQLPSVEAQKATGYQSRCSPPSSSSHSDAPLSRVSKGLPKRRLAGGLPRPNGVSPQGFRRPAAVPSRVMGFERSVLNNDPVGCRDFESSQPHSHRSSGACAAFVPPLVRPAEELPSALEALPLEKAWPVNGAKALLSSICLCCGVIDCCRCADPSLQSGSGLADFFSGIFNVVPTEDALQCQQMGIKADILPPKIHELSASADEESTLVECYSQAEAGTAAESCYAPSPAKAPQSRPDTQRHLEENSNAPLQCWAPSLAVSAEASTAAQGEERKAPPQGFGAGSAAIAAATCGNGGSIPGGTGTASASSGARRSRFFALAGGCVPPPNSGAQTAFYCSGQNGAKSFSPSRDSAQGQGAACVRAFNQSPGPAPPVGSCEAAGGRNISGQTVMKPEVQHPLQAQHCEPWQHGKLQQLPSEKGGTVGEPQPQVLPLLLAEELPEGQLENLVDFVPVTFCTAPAEPPPFNAAYAAARHLFLSTSLEGKGLRASQLALRYFNSVLVSLQTALTETAQQISWSTGCSPGMGEARFLLEGACIRLDGKHHSGFQQRVAEANRQRKAKQQQLRRYHQLRQRKKRRIASGKTVSSSSEVEEQEGTSEASEGEAGVQRQPGLLLDLSKATFLPGPPQPLQEAHNAPKRSSIPFEKAASIKEQLGRNDIWAFSTDEHFEDWSKIVLARSMWRGASPHTSCIKVSVLGPWPAVLNPLRVPLIRFAANGQFTRASLPAPPPLLLQIRQLLQGRCRAIGGIKAVWVGRLHDELASIEACQRLFRAEMALNKLTSGPEMPLKCVDAALELGAACAARLVGLSYQGGGVEAARQGDKTISQLIMVDVSSEEAEAVVCKCSNSGGNWMLNEEQQRVLIAISRWFGYTDGCRPFEPRDETQLEKQHEDSEEYENRSDRIQNSQELRQGELSIFSQEKPHSVFHSKCQTSPPDKQEEGEDGDSSSKEAQGCITTSAAVASADDDDDIADICLFPEDLNEVQQQEDNDLEVSVGSAKGRRPEEGSAFPLDPPSEVAQNDGNYQSPGVPAIATIAGDALGVGIGADKYTPMQVKNSKVVDSDAEKLKGQEAQQPSKAPTGAVTSASSLASTAVGMPGSSAPVFLVQGVFGAGKTTMLAASLATLCRLLDLAKSRSRVLLVCATNAAVDGVLLRLLRQYDCCDFARIGRLSEMQPALLPYAICSSAARNTAVHEFKAVLFGLLAAPGVQTTHASMAKELLKGIDSGAFPPPMQQWKRRRIWATTCSSFASSDLFADGGFRGAASEGTAGSFFPFLLMDEASQVAEPLAAAVLTRAQPLRCIFLGDTRQLPPTTRLRGPVAATASSLFSRLLQQAAPPAAAAEMHNASAHRMEKGAFQTCQSGNQESEGNSFFSVFQMRLQYRCHPDLGRLAAGLFYGPFVAHGVSAAQRLPLLPEWRGALCLAVVRGGRETKAGRSLINVQEASVVARLVHHALHSKQAAGLGNFKMEFHPPRPRPEDLGVICFYRAQADEVKRQLLRVLPKAVVDSVQVSTVDAFQGSEKEVIFLSLVRAHANMHGAAATRGGTPDFLTCPHRVCVALTRARRQLVIVAADTFLKQQNSLWSRVCSQAAQIHF